MATKQKAAPAAAAKTTALVPWERQMAEAAQRQAKAEKPLSGMPMISTRGGMLSVDGDAVKGGVLRGIIVAAIHENTYYSERFDPDSPTAPDCYAYGDLDDEDADANMAPTDEVENKQSEKCADCELNVMGSADTGKGKACKNIRRLIVITEDSLESPEALAAAEMRMLKVPVTSVRNYATYLRDVLTDELQRPTYGVVTAIGTVPDPKFQFKVTFEMADVIPFTQPLWDAMQKKLGAAVKLLQTPYPKQSELDANKAEKSAGRKPLKGQAMKPVGRVAQKAVAGKGRR